MKKGLFHIIIIIVCLLLVDCGTHKKALHSQKRTDNISNKEQIKDIEYQGTPWVTNASKPINITKGLQNKHLSLWASHGKYYNQKTDEWTWQRPKLFCTTEDLFTQTIVIPYLIPMLEKAGAIVFTPRERDWQKKEYIIDNDNKVLLPYYTELGIDNMWTNANIPGFKCNTTIIVDRQNPFKQGTTRKAKASITKTCEISYQPNFEKADKYAVYVSYPETTENVPDAQYTVYHKGSKTIFNVNQRMGGGTWVYLGTFDFDKGCSPKNRVVLSNESAYNGVVTADAVRFGGGMGNISRNGKTSGLPRFLEGSRYYTQWAGAPDSICYSKDGTDDYKEDINARSYMTNWLAGGSCFLPNYGGLNVPIELSLAVHSDAGVTNDYKSIFGTLAICTTKEEGARYPSGLPRDLSKKFASKLLNNVSSEMEEIYGKWNKRDLYDRNYSETRCPYMTSAILETMSHQNFPDMRLGQDPNFRFDMARSIYKTILKHIAKQHDKAYAVTPLAPHNFRICFLKNDTILLKWDAQSDKYESTAQAKSFILYTATGNSDFDNGISIKSNACKIKLRPDILYNFKVSAVNEGGESFTSEILSAVYHSATAKNILIINGFNRLSSPAVIDDSFSQGFDINEDIGVNYGKMPGFCGAQICFDKTKIGKEGLNGLGYSGNELEGTIIMGNEFNYVPIHAKAIMANNKYNIVSCSKMAVEKDKININQYDCIDLILGLEKNDGHATRYYKTFSEELQKKIAQYYKSQGNILVSGAFIASDMTSEKEKQFLENILHLQLSGNSKLQNNNIVVGMNSQFDIYTRLNEDHYACTSIDLISPVFPAFCALTADDGKSVCVAYQGNANNTLAMSFPFECIKSAKMQASLMQGILNFLLKRK